MEVLESDHKKSEQKTQGSLLTFSIRLI